MPSKLVFFDIDGTLISHVGGSHVPRETDEAIALIKKADHIPAIATARNLAMTRTTAARFGIGLLVCCNGAHVVVNGESIHGEWLDSGFLSTFRKRLAPFSENASALDADFVYTGQTSDEFERYLLEQSGFDCRKSLNELSRAHLAYVYSDHLAQTLADAKSGLENVDFYEMRWYTEIRPKGVSKWVGIQKAARFLGFPEEEIVTVGDGSNDVEMLKNAPLGIAVGGAAAEAKSAADEVVGDIDSGGILDVFRRLEILK